MKKSEKLCDEMGLIDEKYIEEAEQAAGDCSPVRRRGIVLRRTLIAAAVAAVVGATAFMIPAMIKGRGTTPPAGIPIESESETEFGTEPLTDEPKQTDPRETEPTPPTNTTHADPEPTNTVPVDPPPIGGSNLCTVHFEGYHSLPYYTFKEYLSETGVSEEDYLTWEKSISSPGNNTSSDCPYEDYTIRAFVERFDIPRDVFVETCRRFNEFDYNPDVIYSEDSAVTDDFYRDLESRVKEKKKMDDFEQLKPVLKEEFAETEEDQHVSLFGPNRLGVLGLVKRFDVPRSFFEEYWAKQDKEYQESIPPFMPGDDPDDQPPAPIVRYDYDLDVLYDEDGTPKTYEDKTEYEIDAMFCGVDELFLGY